MKPNTIQDILGRLIIQENGCALWPGALHSAGYGMVQYQGRTHLVHRLLYEHFVGKVPDGWVLDHRVCDNRACGNFAHLVACSVQENTARAESASAVNERKTVCPAGHPYSGANLRVDNRGSRVCRACCAAKRSAYRERVRAGIIAGRTPSRADRGIRRTSIVDVMLRLELQENGCALWPGAKRNGYGTVRYGGRSHRVHRLLYEQIVGPIPDGLVLDHAVCNTRACANVSHLEVVSDAENTRRSNTCRARQKAEEQ